MDLVMLPPLPTLQLELLAPTVVVAGFPCLLVVELSMPASAEGGAMIPVLSDFDPPPQLSVAWRTDEGVEMRVEAAPSGYEEARALAVPLVAGASRRMLFDVEEMLALAPGSGELEIDYVAAEAKDRCRLAVVAPSNTDSRFAAARPSDQSWRSALLSGTMDLHGYAELSPWARESLALYLAYATAVRAESLAELRNELFAVLPWPLAGEGEALVYELELARGDPHASDTRRAIAKRYPGLVWRLDRVDAGRGTLKVLRDQYGARDGS
jgi:hypothetical protein